VVASRHGRSSGRARRVVLPLRARCCRRHDVGARDIRRRGRRGRAHARTGPSSSGPTSDPILVGGI